MSHTKHDHDAAVEEKPSERRKREKAERDPNKPRKHRPRVLDPETGQYVPAPSRRRKEKDTDSDLTKNMMDVVPELARTASTPGASSRSTIPYPTFSKAHSKETVSVRDDISTTTDPPQAPSEALHTPDATHIDSSDKIDTTVEATAPPTLQSYNTTRRPPSPPETISSDTDRLRHGHASSRSSTIKATSPDRNRTSSGGSIRSWFGRAKEKAHVSQEPRTQKESKRVHVTKSNRPSPTKHGKQADISETSDEDVLKTTSIPPPMDRSTKPRTIPPGLDADDSPDSHHASSPKTPSPGTPVFLSSEFKQPSALYSHPASVKYGSTLPPPPPPPPTVSMDIPRVDYLLQHGGLVRPVPRSLISAASVYAAQPFPDMKTTAPPEFEKVFAPFYNLLDQYESVISKSGSVAVATGYRSVARRLLDRLENVFARDLPTVGCSCLMCCSSERRLDTAPGWGDILEFVCGRRDVPTWPAFDLSTIAHVGSGMDTPGRVAPPRPGSPVQIDPDIAEEFHQHYLRQSKKTKASVDKWLSATPGSAAAPEPDVDDETLTFAILTRLHAEERPLFNAMLNGMRPSTGAIRTTTPTNRLCTDLIVRASLAIRRLYRLPSLPKDPEVCAYLVRNPAFHNLIMSLSEINDSEWEILTSGRFDGFLWSGAESENAYLESSAQSEHQVSPLRSSTPAILRNSVLKDQPNLASHNTASRQAVSLDEDAEIAALAALELQIYHNMEQLEDAFEGLHRKAEIVRTALRDRGAGLAVSAQRRGARSDGVYARLDTPGLGERGWNRDGETDVDIESDWDDGVSEIAPNDSASQISSSRYRRPKRRVERRTPAAVEEEDEEE